MKFLILLSSLLLLTYSYLNPGYKSRSSRHVASGTCESMFTSTRSPSFTLQKFKNLFRARQGATEVKQVVALPQNKKVKSIGIEFEGFYDMNKTHRGEIAMHLLKYLNTHIPEKNLYPITIEYNYRQNKINLATRKDLEELIQTGGFTASPEFVISYRQGVFSQKWIVQDENSVYGPTNLEGFEVSSPIIRSEASQNLFLSFLKELTDRSDIFVQHPRVLKKDLPPPPTPIRPGDVHVPQLRLVHSSNGALQIQSTSREMLRQKAQIITRNMRQRLPVRSGGLHIHIGKESFKREDQLMLIKTLYLFEPQMFEYFNVSESRQKSAVLRPMREDLDRTTKDLDEIARRILKNPFISDKWFYFAIRHDLKTLEFRLFESTADPKVIRHEIEFVTKLSQAILNKQVSFVNFIKNQAEARARGEDKLKPDKDFLKLLEVLQIKPMRIR